MRKNKEQGEWLGKLFNPSQSFCSSLACSFSRSLAQSLHLERKRLLRSLLKVVCIFSAGFDLILLKWFSTDRQSNCMLAYCCTVRSFICCSLLLRTQSEHTCSFCMTNQSLTRQPLMTKLLFPRLAIVTYFFWFGLLLVNCNDICHHSKLTLRRLVLFLGRQQIQ